MIEHIQPDPDELLKAVQKQEQQKSTGKLKIFFGMSAGVGKTYAMLEEAQRCLKNGVNVIAGTINTHGRKETEELLKGIPVISERWVKYRDVSFEEMDLEEILKRKPSIVLVDELAHTNVPGSRHNKRWQDVVEILDSGIDVYTTLNVQHLESRKDLVESITGIQIRETVPDLILERASSIELIDITPAELLKRLSEGKVYLGVQSKLAADNFFREDTLTALREIALRFTAEKVEHDLHTILSPGKKGWKSREKLMVAIDPKPYSQQLIRITRRKAFEVDASWIAVFVDTGQPLSNEEKTQLSHHFNLVQELGGESINTKDSDIAAALQRIARQKNISQIVIGRPKNRSPLNILQRSLLERLEEENRFRDLIIIRQESDSRKFNSHFSQINALFSPLGDYIKAVAAVLFLTLLGYLSSLFVGHKAIGFIFLIGIVFLSPFFTQGPILLIASLSTLAWNQFFTPPVFATATSAGSEIVLAIIFFFTAAIIGLLISKITKQEQFLKARERKLEDLYEIEKIIATAPHFQNLRKNLCLRLQSIFDGQFDLIVPNIKSETQSELNLSPDQQEKEQTTIDWVLENGKIAGWSTNTLPSSKGLYLPIKFSHEVVGYLVFYPKRVTPLSVEEMNFLQNITQQLGIYLEKHLSEERSNIQVYATQLEKIQSSIQESLSVTLFKPIQEMEKSLENFHQTQDQHSIESIERSLKLLNLMMSHLFLTTQLKSGIFHLNKKEENFQNFLHDTINNMKFILNDYQFEVSLPPEPIVFSFDRNVLQAAFENLFLTIIQYIRPNTLIKIFADRQHQFIVTHIDFESEVLNQASLENLFQTSSFSNEIIKKEFYHLSTTKMMLDVHQGEINLNRLNANEVNCEIILST